MNKTQQLTVQQYRQSIKSKPKKQTGSVTPETVIWHLKREFGGEWIGEHQFAKELKRKFRFDCCCKEFMIAVEVDGAVFSQGRHTRGAGFLKDIEKLNLATSLGWRVFRIDTKGSIADLIENIKRLAP